MRFKNLIDAVENKYNQLLTILVALYLVYPFTIEGKFFNLIVFSTFVGSLNIVMYQIQHSKHIFRLNLGLSLVAVILRSFNYLGFLSGGFQIFCIILSTLILLFFLMSSLYLILLEVVVTSSTVTADTIKGAISSYFLLGLFWTYLYYIIYLIDANSFNSMVTQINLSSSLLYFSFTTLTTTGYGDILPANPMARVAANLESIVGVLYPTVAIARLVGLYKS
jgi:hypothetical protein